MNTVSAVLSAAIKWMVLIGLLVLALSSAQAQTLLYTEHDWLGERLLSGQKVRISKLVIPVGGHIGMHTHSNDFCRYSIQGSLEVIPKDPKLPVQITMPGEATCEIFRPHVTRNISNVDAIIIIFENLKTETEIN